MLLLARSSENTIHTLLPFILQFCCLTLRVGTPWSWEEWSILGYRWVTHDCTAVAGRVKVIICVQGHSLKCRALKLWKKTAHSRIHWFFFFYFISAASQPLRRVLFTQLLPQSLPQFFSLFSKATRGAEAKVLILP